MKHRPTRPRVLNRAQTRRSGKFEKTPRSGHLTRFTSAAAMRFALTQRENEVMRHLAKGLLYKEVADIMKVSCAVVHKLQHKIFVKLQVGTRTEAVLKWYGFSHQS